MEQLGEKLSGALLRWFDALAELLAQPAGYGQDILLAVHLQPGG